MTPWDELLDAQMESLDALRSDDADRQRRALDAREGAEETLRCVGGLLVLYGMESREVQRKLAKVFGELARQAWRRALAAEKRAQWAIAKLDAMECRMRELEQRLADKACGRVM